MSHRLASGMDYYFYEGSLTNTTISVEIARVKIQRRKIFTSPSPDGILTCVLKQCAEIPATPLSILFKRSLANSHVRVGRKLAKIKPINKKGDRTHPDNHQLVAILPIIFRVMDSVLDDLIGRYLLDLQLISLHQHGFIKCKISYEPTELSRGVRMPCQGPS